MGTWMGVSRYFVELNSMEGRRQRTVKIPAELSDLCDPCKFLNSIIVFYIFQIDFEQRDLCSGPRYQYLK